jgi:hypothetical protein
MACGWMRRRRRLAGGYGGGLVILEVSVEQKWDKKREKILHRAATWWAPVWVVFLAPRWSTRVGAGATDNYSGDRSADYDHFPIAIIVVHLTEYDVLAYGTIVGHGKPGPNGPKIPGRVCILGQI